MHTKDNDKEEWTEVIMPKAGLFDIRLKELWKYRDLLMLFVKRDLVAQYRQTILGPLWYIIQPALTTIMFLVVFNRIARISTDDLPPVLFYMCGIAIWNYFSSCLNNTSGTFVNNAGIFGKVYFPRLVLPLSVVLSNMARFGIQFGLLVIVICWYYFTGQFAIDIGWPLLLIPVIALIMALTGFGLGIVISSLTTKYRDLNVLISFGVQLLMYVTPVAYPLSFLENASLKVFIQWNPLSPLVEGFRYAVYGTGVFQPGMFLYSVGCMLLILFLGTMVFSKVERSFMDTV